MYFAGLGVSRDYAQALIWFHKATDQGYAGGQSSLGFAYALGLGVPKDDVLAYMWFNLAASNPNDPASDGVPKMRDLLASAMTPDQLAEAQKMAREWKPK